MQLIAVLPLLGATENEGDLQIPVDLRGGRFFAVPQTIDGRNFACWLDTDGSGFVFDSAVERFELLTSVSGGSHVAALPRFAPTRSIPPLVTSTTLPIFERTASDLADPILQGFDAQLGGSWFAQRAWRLDFVRGTMTMLASPSLASTTDVLKLSFEELSPQVRVRVGDEPDVAMSFDIAASVAYLPRYAEGVEVRATSFIPRATLERWRTKHPEWVVDRNVSPTAGVDRIIVPEIYLGKNRLDNVAFTTRPDDDVFAGGRAGGKLGASAYGNRVVWIDYTNATIRL
jgi:hypothetical protein